MRLTIIGDTLLDRDVSGVAERLCPDAPVPVIDERSAHERPGGAGLAAVLAGRHDVEVTLVTALADDTAGHTVRHLLGESGIDVVTVHDAGSTSEKTRIMVDDRPMLRVDRGARGALGPLPGGVEPTVVGADAVLVADYGRGLLDVPELRDVIASTSRPVVWDPHPRGAEPPPGVTLATPNRRELDHFSARMADSAGTRVGSDQGLEAVSRRAMALRRQWCADALAVTLGERGATVVTASGPPFVVPIEGAPANGDACGAGDAFAVAAAIALARGADTRAAVFEAVRSAATFVGDGGVRHLLQIRQPSQWPEPPDTDPLERSRRIRAAGGTVVATGGCFDLLHAGHVATLQSARALGDHLVVLLNSDASIRRLKGDGRPVQHAADRAAVLRSLGCVDDVVVFDDDLPVEMLRRLRPHVFVKGGDYAGATIPETDVLATWGGIVVTVPFVDGRSTTAMLERASRSWSGPPRDARSDAR